MAVARLNRSFNYTADFTKAYIEANRGVTSTISYECEHKESNLAM